MCTYLYKGDGLLMQRIFAYIHTYIGLKVFALLIKWFGRMLMNLNATKFKYLFTKNKGGLKVMENWFSYILFNLINIYFTFIIKLFELFNIIYFNFFCFI